MNLALICLSFIALTTNAQIVNIPDANFKAALIAPPNNVDINHDSEIQLSEAQVITWLRLNNKSISDLTGIETFTALYQLECDSNQLTSLNVTQNTALFDLECDYNQLTSLDVSQNTALAGLYCSYNQLTSLDVSKNIALEALYFSSNKLTSIDVTNNTALQQLCCAYDSLLTSIIGANNKSALSLVVFQYNTQLTSLDVSNDPALTDLYCDYNQLTSINLTNNTALKTIQCPGNKLTSINVSTNTALESLFCDDNQLTNIDVSNNTELWGLSCPTNQITNLDVTNNTALSTLWCYDNPNLFEICVNSTQLGLTTTDPTNWTKDSFASWSTNCTTSIDENLTLHAPKLLYIFNLMGQKVNPEKIENGIFIYQYNDGSIRKIGKFDTFK
ncbi:MAG TPA: hypothetical protein PKK00_14350 [Bacteroidales bacterium]|nr:hypothetical protein [Bacteroidales bacterium]HPS18360.1 hypothetical protein [Bacteroidales bacterium]